MVKVKLFANFREAVGRRELEIKATTVKELISRIAEEYPAVTPLLFENGKLRDYVHIMVNGKSANEDTEIGDGDVVAIFPPVSGG